MTSEHQTPSAPIHDPFERREQILEELFFLVGPVRDAGLDVRPIVAAAKELLTIQHSPEGGGEKRFSTNSPAATPDDNQPASETADRQPGNKCAQPARNPPSRDARPPHHAPVIQFGHRQVYVRFARTTGGYSLELFGRWPGLRSADTTPLGMTIEIPDDQNPLATLAFPSEAHARQVLKALAQIPTIEVDDAMVDRALDAWDQWWKGYPLPMNEQARRQAMDFTLKQVLEVRP